LAGGLDLNRPHIRCVLNLDSEVRHAWCKFGWLELAMQDQAAGAGSNFGENGEVQAKMLLIREIRFFSPPHPVDSERTISSA
jgi:hypothetical protein